ncbi:MAG: ribonuclease P protein component [Candidatus Aminicenantes bacterium]|jgi:ribonuclease P protein component
MDETFAPAERIRKKKEFFHLYKKGKRYRGKYFNLVYLSSASSSSRIGVVVSKKVGNAVKRNKIKRWIRTLFRRNKNLLKIPLDIIVIVKKEILEASWFKLQEDYSTAIKSISENNSSP